MTFLKTGFWLTFLFSLSLWSGVKQVWDMENTLRVRVKNVLNTYDHMANVSVKIETKKVDVALPGTVKKKSQILMLDDTGAISDESISKVTIQVTTHAAGKGSWLESEIRKEVNMGKIPVDVKIAVFSSQQKEAMKDVARVIAELNPAFKTDSPKKENDEKTDVAETHPVAPAVPQINVQMPPSPLNDWFFWQKALLPLVGLLLFGFFMHARSMKSIITSDLKPVTEKTKSENANVENRSARVAEPVARRADKAPVSQEKLDGYSTESLNYLLADCYWCEKDAYAGYVWRRMSPSQQNQLLKISKIPLDYFKIISDKEEKNENYHNDPVYLSENPWMLTDQNDLLAAVKAQPGLYAHLPRMRQETLELSLAERIQMQNNSYGYQSLSSLKLSTSVPRKLSQAIKIKTVTFEDELWILENHHSIEEKDMASLNSLVWLLVIPVNEARAILESFDARTLAAAWHGHPAVLEKMSKLISDVKMKNIKFFLEQNSSSPESDEFLFLSNQGRNSYIKSKGIKENQFKKAA